MTVPQFLADRPRPWPTNLIAFVMPLAMRLAFGVASSRWATGAKAMLEAAWEGAVVTCNHPTDADPPILWRLLRRTGVRARFMTARDVMARQAPWLRRALLAAGCFSVRRETLDRAAIKRALHHLRARRTVVIFPEGRTHGLGSRLRPFAPGAASIAAWAARSGGPAPLLPLAVFYRARRPADAIAALDSLESDLGSAPTGTPYERLRRCGLAVLAAAEAEEGLGLAPEVELDERVARLYGAALDRLEERLGIGPSPSATHEDRILALRLALDGHEGQDRAPLWRRLMRLHRFGTLEDGHVAERPTPERVLDLVGLLRWDRAAAAGKPAPRPPLREAVFAVGEPLAPSGDTQADTLALESATRTLMDRMEADLSAPLERFL